MRYGYMYNLPLSLDGCNETTFLNNTEGFPTAFNNIDAMPITTLTNLNMTTNIIVANTIVLQATTQCLVARLHSPKDTTGTEINKLTVYPNPSNGIFNLTLDETLDNEITIFDSKGNIVNAIIDYNTIDISSYPTGV